MYILFGAGNNCEICLRTMFNLLKADQVAYVADNFKAGETICGKEIISFERLAKIHHQYHVVLTVIKAKVVRAIAKQFRDANIPLHSWDEIVLKLLREKANNIDFYNSYRNEIDYMINSNKPQMIPYPDAHWHLPKLYLNYDTDEMMYVCECYGRQLFFPAESGDIDEQTRVKEIILGLLAEQNVHSPHRYFTDKHRVSSDDIFVDAGGAEALTSLEVLDVARHIYIFEGDRKWHKALHCTFAPYQDKVTIVPKYIGAIDDDETVRIDSYFHDIEGNLFFKVDIEGNERSFLQGAKETLCRKGTKISLCTYHYPSDAEEFTKQFQSWGYACSLSPGYVFAYGDFMRGVMYGALPS